MLSCSGRGDCFLIRLKFKFCCCCFAVFARTYVGDGCVPTIFMKSQEVPSVSSICWWCQDVLRLCWCASYKSSYLQSAQAVRAKVDNADTSSHFSWPFRLESLLNNFYVVCFSVDQYQENISLLALALDLWNGRTVISSGWSITALYTKLVFMLRKCLFFSIYICIYSHIWRNIYVIHTHICSVLFSVMLRIEPVSFHILSCIPNPISCT